MAAGVVTPQERRARYLARVRATLNRRPFEPLTIFGLALL
jgi:hypothetical protein